MPTLFIIINEVIIRFARYQVAVLNRRTIGPCSIEAAFSRSMFDKQPMSLDHIDFKSIVPGSCVYRHPSNRFAFRPVGYWRTNSRCMEYLDDCETR